MRSYTVTLTGKMPILMHADNIEWSDAMDAWKNDPENKKRSKAGDDRSPAFRWLGSLYHDGKVVGIPNDNLMRVLMEGGAQVPVPGAKNNKTFKAQSQSGLLVEGSHWPLLVNGKSISVAPLLALQQELDFSKHRQVVSKLGFELFVKRVPVQQRKHVRVRPRFDHWSATGTVLVTDDQITLDVLRRIVREAGLYKGLGDWRPGAKTPGPYGVFSADVQ